MECKPYWIKRFTECNSRMTEQFNIFMIGNEEKEPTWLTKGRTVLALKLDTAKGSAGVLSTTKGQYRVHHT